MSVALSVLDLAPIGAGQTAADALQGTTQLARRADELGFRRFWVAEHHNIPSVASTAPEVLVAHIAASTERIRVGSGGVMLPNHAPPAVAERFAMLEALRPDRIDLGLGRAPGTDMRTAMALRSTSPDHFEDQFTQLLGDLGRGYAGMRAVAGEHNVPELWMLGSTDGGARIAAALGLPFVFAHHFHPHLTEPALDLYRGLFEPSELLDAPRTIVAAGIVVGGDDEDAARRALPGGVAMLRLRQAGPRRSRASSRPRRCCRAWRPPSARGRRRGDPARDRRWTGDGPRGAAGPRRARGHRRAHADLAGHRRRTARAGARARRAGVRARARAAAGSLTSRHPART